MFDSSSNYYFSNLIDITNIIFLQISISFVLINFLQKKLNFQKWIFLLLEIKYHICKITFNLILKNLKLRKNITTFVISYCYKIERICSSFDYV